ncbi:DNA mismatch repair protein MutS [Aureimonas leprariae]|uniref:DNA mismatch repair protein MutS n=1 Tax=Plantimonas leprariae TaxID=2615207 RepID=A0A7V7PTB7_9HYPH|nr:DNA mismatch repair protein MutS [Aureimonas leprariae]KAB0682863.1 DNA mismatch repair protein MutS [Aureimonas leprariae]
MAENAAISATDTSGGGAPTPMMAQYIEIKAANADSLLFYRMGDFYELFFEDAAVAARALGIALTKRGKHLGQDIPMAGVPVVSADEYLAKLISLGHRVAVCEQVEDPAEAKKRGGKSVVRRDVVRLVTPGTITEEALLEPGRPNHVAAMARLGGANGAFAIAWAELSTGAFAVRSTEAGRLLADIRAIDPAELVVGDALFHDEALKPVFASLGRLARPEPASLFDGATAEGRLARFFDVATMGGFGDFARAELAAAAGLLAYLARTQVAARPPLGRLARVETGETMLIDPATRASLELTRSVAGRREGSLLGAVDRTVTGAGSRLLAARIANPLAKAAAIARRHDAVSFLLAERRLGDALRAGLKGLPDGERALSRVALGRGGPRDLGALRTFLEGARETAAVLAGAEALTHELGEAAGQLRALPGDLEAELSRTLGDDLPLQKRDGGFVAAGAIPDLDEARSLRDESRRVIMELQATYAAETGIRSLKIKHNNVLGYFIEVAEAQAGALNGTEEARRRFFHRQTMANCMRFSTGELADLESRIAAAAATALKLELDAFERLVVLVCEAAAPIRDAAQALAVLDVSAALADLASAENWTRPLVDDSLAFRIEGGRHPVVEAALKSGSGDPFVPNDCDLSGEAGSHRGGAIWLVTGPNMGGKSTFLRQNALIAVLAQAGSFVPAATAHLGTVDRLFSRVGASDDLAEGRSTFMVEMVETAAILNQAGPRSLVILDEIGRGTSTYDGLSIAFAAVEHLHEVNRCRALFATHFHEMTALSARLDRLSNATMRVKEWQGDVVFLHEVRPGTADRSYGIQVAKLAGLPPRVVTRARDVLRQLERSGEGRRAAFVDDLPLFSAAASRQEPAAPAEPPAAVEALKSLDLDALSPREALDALYRLKAMT